MEKELFKLVVISAYDNLGKLHLVKAIKERLNIGLLEAKNWVENLPKEIEDQTREDIAFYQEMFRCEVMSNNYNPYIPVSMEPDEATATALMWYDAQPKYIQEMVDLVNHWKQPRVYAACGGMNMHSE